MTDRREARTGNERTRSTDTIFSVAQEIVDDLGAMKKEIGALLDDNAEHEVKHALLGRVAALQGAINLIAQKVGGCEYVAQCPLHQVLDYFADAPTSETTTSITTTIHQGVHEQRQ